MTCSHCGARIIEGAAYCNKCRKEIKSSKKPVDKKNCPSCGTKLGKDAKFCRKCGEKT